MRINQLDGLVAFVAVAQSGSFTAAAMKLEVSTQAISQSIKALEDRIGVRLFHRTTRSVRLTQDGEWFFERVDPALAKIANAAEHLSERRKKPTGVLRISVPRPAFSGVLENGLLRFLQQYPDIEIDLRFDDGFVDIVEEGLDAGIRLGHSVPMDMVGTPLTESERFVVVGAPEYLNRKGRPNSVADLLDHQCIRFRSPTSGLVYKWKLVEGSKSSDLDVSGPIVVNDTTALATCASLGLGLAYVLRSAVRAQLASGSLEELLTDLCPSLPGLYLYYPGHRQVPAKLRCFIDFWKAAARN